MAQLEVEASGGDVLNGRGSDRHLKRVRSHTAGALLTLEDKVANDVLAQPLLPLATPLEPMASFFLRLCDMDLSRFQVKQDMDDDGLYLFKRPVRGFGGANALAQGGSLFHHVIIFVKAGDKLSSLQVGPEGEADITSNIMEAAPAAPILSLVAASPQAEGLPFLYISHPHHTLESSVVTQAISFRQALPYHAILGNCIQFADFIVRILTDGEVRGAPLIYDKLCGTIPQQQSPLLMMLYMTMMKTWLDICDGSALMADYLQQQHAQPSATADSSKLEVHAEPALKSTRTTADRTTSVQNPAETSTCIAKPSVSIVSEASADTYQRVQSESTITGVAGDTAVEVVSTVAIGQS